jgi:hypothetical protein
MTTRAPRPLSEPFLRESLEAFDHDLAVEHSEFLSDRPWPTC